MSNSQLYQRFRSQYNGLGLTQKEISSRWHEFKLANNLTRKRSPGSINSPRRGLEDTFDGLSISKYESQEPPFVKSTEPSHIPHTQGLDTPKSQQLRGTGKIKGSGFMIGYFEGTFNGEFDGLFHGTLNGEFNHEGM